MLTTAPALVWAFVAIQLAAFTRAVVPLFVLDGYAAGLWASGALWTIAFGIYVVVYGPILSSPRVDGKPG